MSQVRGHVELAAERRPAHALGMIAANWAAVAVALIWLLKVPNLPPPLYVLGFVFIAIQQHALSMWLHEAGHWLLFESKRLNDVFSDIVLANPLYVSTYAYRIRHLDHHRYLGDATNDANQVIFISLRGWRFWAFLVRCMLGIRFLEMTWQYLRASKNRKMPWISMCVVQVLILGAFTWVGGWQTYFWFWLLPFVTVFQFIASIRCIIEHQTLEGEAPPFTRNLYPSPFERFLFCRAGFDYHWVHHVYMDIPCFNLREYSRGKENRQVTPVEGYFATLGRLIAKS